MSSTHTEKPSHEAAMKPKLADAHKWLVSQQGNVQSKITVFGPEGARCLHGNALYKSFGKGLFLEGRWTMRDSNGTPCMEARELIGFDIRKEEYWAIWVDDYADYPVITKGKQEGDVITFRGIADNKMCGVMDCPIKQVLNVKTKTMEIFRPADASDTECTQLVLRSENTVVPGPQHMSMLNLLVADLDDAKQFYVDRVGLLVKCDAKCPKGTRTVMVRPPGDEALGIRLALPSNEEERARIGRQDIGGMTFMLSTPDCNAAYETLKGRGVTFTRPPTDEVICFRAQFRDLYGNTISLLQMKC